MDKDKTLVSIIVPVYNAELYLEECINSILEQTYKNLEIILIDDGSTDNSFEIMKQYSENDSRVQSLSISNSGPGKCRNVGLDIFSGDFVMFVDSDDRICRDLVEILLEHLESSSEIAMCKFSKEIQKIAKGTKKVENQTSIFVDSIKSIYLPGFIFRTSC